MNGHVQMVERLLADPRIDPSAANSYALWLAVSHDQLHVVERLLADPRVDPSARENQSIRYAIDDGRLDIAEALLADPRVDPAAAGNELLCHARRVAVVVRLLAEERVLDALADATSKPPYRAVHLLHEAGRAVAPALLHAIARARLPRRAYWQSAGADAGEEEPAGEDQADDGDEGEGEDQADDGDKGEDEEDGEGHNAEEGKGEGEGEGADVDVDFYPPPGAEYFPLSPAGASAFRLRMAEAAWVRRRAVVAARLLASATHRQTKPL